MKIRTRWTKVHQWHAFWVKKISPSKAISGVSLREKPNGFVVDLWIVRISIGSGAEFFW